MTIDTDTELRIPASGLMDLEKAARYLGVDLGTGRWMRRVKQVPFVKLGVKLHVKKQDLDAYVEAMTEPAC